MFKTYADKFNYGGHLNSKCPQAFLNHINSHIHTSELNMPHPCRTKQGILSSKIKTDNGEINRYLKSV